MAKEPRPTLPGSALRSQATPITPQSLAQTGSGVLRPAVHLSIRLSDFLTWFPHLEGRMLHLRETLARIAALYKMFNGPGEARQLIG